MSIEHKIRETISDISIFAAMRRYNEERALYADRKGRPPKFYLIDTESSMIYAAKILIALAYLYATKSKLTYDEFNNLHEDYKGKENFTFDIISTFANNHHMYEAKELSSNERKEYESNLKEYFKSIDRDSSKFEGTEREAVVKARVNQGKFRNLMLSTYKECAICGVSLKETLIVSHIKTWQLSTPEERTDINNALLLCAGHDKLFDRNLISFDDSGRIIISPKISFENRKLLNIKETDILKVDMNKYRQSFMSIHRSKYEERNI